jgi:hypothetical protein
MDRAPPNVTLELTSARSKEPLRFPLIEMLVRPSRRVESAELGFVALFAAALFVGLVFAVPGSVAWKLYNEGRLLLAGLVAALPVLAVVGVARDLRTGRLSWLSGGLAVLGIGCLAYVLAHFILE